MSNTSVTPVAFDPKSPSALILFKKSSSYYNHDHSDSSVSKFQLQTFLAEDGVGCNHEETSALMLLLQQREEFQSSNASAVRNSQTYRDIILNCIEECDMNLLQQKDQKQADDELECLTAEQMELLKLTHTIAYLCEIYLLRPDNDDQGDVEMKIEPPPTSISSHFYNTTWSSSGTVTADTVRYLRYCHTYPLEQYIARRMVLSSAEQQQQQDLDVINEMLNSNQPEYYYDPKHSSSTTSSTSTVSFTAAAAAAGTTITPYWELFRKLILRGQLDMAWAVLSRHSACKRSLDPSIFSSSSSSSSTNNPVSQIQREDREAFALLRALLLSAPLPGGRSDDQDDGLGELSSHKNDYENRSSIDHDAEAQGDDMVTLIPGIPRKAYKLWNTNENDTFQVQAAMHVYKTWKFQVEQVMKINVPLMKLVRRIPMLESCMFDIILHTKQSFTSDDSWAERLMAELMYVQPDIPKENVHIRASDWIRTCMEGDTDMEGKTHSIEDMLIQIMKGDAGSVIKALKLYGGSSGAALPTTMTALSCSLLVETGRIDLSQQTFDIETELVVAAASSILASFSMQNQEGVGVSLCTQFLKPHVIPENPIVTAYLAEILSRHYPETDAEVISLLEQCSDAVSRASREILDACDLLVFSRALHYEQRGDLRKAVEMIIRGLEFSLLFGSETQDMMTKQHYATLYSYTTCFRRLTIICANLTATILEEMFEYLFDKDDNEMVKVRVMGSLKQSKGISEIVSSEEVSSLVCFAPSVSLLRHVVEFSWSFIHGEYAQAAANIVECLKERKDMDGSVIILATRMYYGYFLSFAYKILSMEEESSPSLSQASASFDVQGMRVLYCRMTEFCSQEEDHVEELFNASNAFNSMNIGNKFRNHLPKDVTLDTLRLALAKGLMRAFIVENHKLKTTKRSMLPSQEVHTKHRWKTTQDMEHFLGPSL